MREIFTTRDAFAKGITKKALSWGVKTGKWRRVAHGVYVTGSEPVDVLGRALAIVKATNGVATGTLAATLHNMDCNILRPPFATVSIATGKSREFVRRADIDPAHIIDVNGFRCTDGLQTLYDLAAQSDIVFWEQYLEAALRQNLLRLDDIDLSQRRVGNAVIREVLKLRPEGAPPAESLLETLGIQLIRNEPLLPTPTRQVKVWDGDRFVARVDLAYPDFGIYIELDGEGFHGQPKYDSARQTDIVAVTDGRVIRFGWTMVNNAPRAVARKLLQVFENRRAA